VFKNRSGRLPAEKVFSVLNAKDAGRTSHRDGLRVLDERKICNSVENPVIPPLSLS